MSRSLRGEIADFDEIMTTAAAKKTDTAAISASAKAGAVLTCV
jgi:hypothetical protein